MDYDDLIADMGTNFAARAKDRGISIAEIARRSDVHRNSVGAWFNGKGIVSLKIAMRVADTLGIKVEVVIDGGGDE